MEAKEEQDLCSLFRKEMEYRHTLLDKYAGILARSEDRVDNINHMIGDLLKLSTDCGQRFDKEQANMTRMIDVLVDKDKRIHELEQKLEEERDRYDELLDKYIVSSQKVNENNFNLK